MKTRKHWVWFGLGSLFSLLFVVWTLVVKFVDVQVGGESNVAIGLGSLNIGFFDAVGSSNFWQSVTKYLGYLTILVVVGLLVWQLVLMIRQKSWRLARHWWVLDGVLVALVVTYLLFETLVINERPILVDGVAGASYPSSHGMLFMTILPLAILTIWREIKCRPLNVILTVVLSILLLVGVVGRTLCGLHWLTDVFGAVWFSLAALFFDIALTFPGDKLIIKQQHELR